MSPKEVIALAKSRDIKIVDLKFTDISGAWQHIALPVSELSEALFQDGIGFDGSSIRGWKSIEASDMLLIPDPSTSFIDPFFEVRTLSLICDIEDPVTREPYARSPRGIARQAEAWLRKTGIADTVCFGPEAEFFIFDDVRYEALQHSSFFKLNSDEAAFNSSRDEQPNLGYKLRQGEGYLHSPPADRHGDLRNEMVMILQEMGVQVERHQHEVAACGQAEIDLKFGTLLRVADDLCKTKYVVRNVAWRRGKSATFMPKPVFGEPGSGLHTHQSLWKDGQTMMAGDGYANLSKEAHWYIGGLLKHARALCAITNPTTNSYKRLLPGFEAPVLLAWAARNRSAIVRIPTYSENTADIRIEYRCPDPSGNPYLAFSAMLMAGVDGIRNQISPGDAIDRNLYDLPPEDEASLRRVPLSLSAALDALEDDHSFLLEGEVFTRDFIRKFIAMRREEVDSVQCRPHPKEFELYYDV